jgi:chromosome segregation ATPase
MTAEKGISYEFPEIAAKGTTSIEVWAPSKYKLFIRHCQTCIGITSFIHEWNQGVEEALNGKFNMKLFEVKLQKLQDTISSLVTVTGKQEDEIIQLSRRNKQLEASKEWFDKFSYLQQAKDTEEMLAEKVRMYRYNGEMAIADKESAEFNRELRMLEELVEWRNREIEKNRRLEEALADRDRERSIRLEIQKSLGDADKDNKHAVEENHNLEQRLTSQTATTVKLQELCNDLLKQKDNLEHALETKSRQMETMRVELTHIKEDLEAQLKMVNSDYATKEDEVDSLRKEVRSLKVSEYHHRFSNHCRLLFPYLLLTFYHTATTHLYFKTLLTPSSSMSLYYVRTFIPTLY